MNKVERLEMEKDKEIVCLSQMRAVIGKEEEVKSALQALVAPSRNEPGCLAYELWNDLSDPCAYIV